MKKIFAVVFLLLLGLATISWAAEDISSIPVEVKGDQVEYFQAEKKVVGKGNVVVTYKDIKMTCKQVTAFLDSKEATAEGDVVVTKGDDILRGQKIIYNFETELGTIIDGVAKADVWYGGGKELKKVSPTEIDIKDGYITTCDLMKPHYSIRSRQVRIYLGKRVVAKNVTFNIGNVPVMYLPVYSQPVNENFPKVNLVPGYDKKWGGYLLSSYRYNFTDDAKGNLHLDYRNNKGLGEGADFNLRTKDFGRGNLRVYYINERDKNAHTKRERWRAQYRHKWEVRPDTTVVVEYHKLKDKDVIKDYFYREEFEKDEQPATYASLNYAKDSFTTSILGRKRINNFFTEVERLPEAEFNFKNQQLLEALPIFYRGDFSAANLNKKFADSSQENHVIRLDAYDQLSLPFRTIDFLSIDPYLGARETFYTRENDTDKHSTRNAFYAGVDLSSNFYRIYDYRTNLFNMDIDGMRHICTPNINYYYITKPTTTPDRLYDFDEVDELNKKNGVGFALENKLQTKRLENDELKTAELLRHLLTTDYLFHLDEGSRFSDITSDLELTPHSWFFIKQTALYAPKGNYLKFLETDVSAHDPKDKWRLGLGHIYEHKTASQLTGEVESKITPKWKVRAFEMFEFRGHDFKQQEYSVTRDLHCWEAEFTYSVRDVHTFWVIFRLKAFPELPLKLGTSYYRPKTGSGSD